MVIKRLKTSECGSNLPKGLTGTALGPRQTEPKNKSNTKPPKRGSGSQETQR